MKIWFLTLCLVSENLYQICESDENSFLFVLLVKICTKFVIRVKIWFLLIYLVGGNLY